MASEESYLDVLSQTDVQASQPQGIRREAAASDMDALMCPV